MWLLYYYLRTWIACLRRHKSFHKTPCYKGGTMYKSYKGADKKNKFQVYKELNKLCKYWRGYPDTYFRFSMFLKDYGDFHKMTSFIPQCAYGRYTRNSATAYQILINDKILFHDMMRAYHLPTTERYFAFCHGHFVRLGSIISDSEVDSILSTISDNRIFIKRNQCGEGSGVSVADYRNNGYYTKDGMLLTAENIRNRFNDDEYLFEKRLIQDPQTEQFNPDSVNTCRVLTYKNKVISGALRMGRKGSFLDNAAQGGIVVNIDVETGRLSDYGLREYDVTKYYQHPDTQVPFKGVTINQWDMVKNLVEHTCQLLPYYRSVGFDIVCTPTGPIILEINTGTGVYASQMGRDYGIADSFLKG